MGFARGQTRDSREERQGEKDHIVKVLNAKLRPLDLIGLTVKSYWKAFDE